MKKWFIIIFLIIGVLFQTMNVFTEETNNVSASIDASGKVTIIGNIGIDAGKMVNIAISNPSGDIVYAGYCVTTSFGSFIKTHDISNLIPGKYCVYVGALGLDTPIKCEIEYGTRAELSELRLSTGSLNEVFDVEKLTYTVTVDYRTNQIYVVPTASDPMSTIKVNQKEVISGSESDSITLLEGDNTIDIVVTALNGNTKEYSILVKRASTISTELTGGVSIDDNNQLKIQGTVDSGSGQMVLLRITNPEDTCIYVGAVISGTEGAFSKVYSLEDELKGKYEISIGVLGVSQPLELLCEYGTNAELQSLKIDGLSFEPIFSPEVETYVLTIGGLIKSINLYAVPQDPNSTIKINDSVLGQSGMMTIPIDESLQEIKVKVTAQDQLTTKEYTIMLASDIDVSATLETEGKVRIEGKVISPESLVSVMVLNPKGVLDYVGFAKAQKDNSFSLNYSLNNPVIGQYKVVVNTLDLVRPAFTYFKCLSAENHLKNLTVSGIALSPTFEADTLSYYADVPYSADSVKLSAIAEDEAANVSVNDAISGTGSVSGSMALAVGKNKIVIEVTAENGEIKTYEVTLNRYQPPVISTKSSNNYLSALSVSNGVFANAFSSQGTEFTVNVPNEVSSVTIMPITKESHATVKVDGIAVSSGQSSGSIALVAGGTRQVLVEVTAENGSKRIYLLNIKRVVSSNVLLSMLTLNNGELTPQFDASTNSYEVQVPNNITGVRVTPTSADDTATIEVNGSEVLSGHASGAIDIPSGSSTLINVKVVAQNKATNTYSIHVERAASGNTDLANLSVNAGALNPVFTANNTNYSVEVPYTVSTIKLTPTVSDVFQTVKINGVAVISGHPSQNIQLVVGNNEILVVVTAQNGTTKTYTVNVVRGPSNNADLGQLLAKPSSGNQLTGDVSQNTIAFTVSNSATTIQIAAMPMNADASIEVNTIAVNNAQWSGDVALNVGVNSILVKVIAQDGITEKIYTIKVTRLPSSDATLSMLTTSIGNLSPVFSPTETAYNLNVANDVASISLTPTINENHASVAVDGQSVNSGDPYEINSLTVGVPKVVQVVVTAEDATTTKTYTVTITRGLSSNANLSGLTISHGELSTIFDQDTTSYSVDVPNSVVSVSITPTVEENNATIKVNTVTVTSGQQSQEIDLISGASADINVVVTAQDGTTKTYTISVNRAPSDNANLASLALSSGVLNSPFDPGDTSYTVSVANSVTSINVTHTVEESHATVKVNNVTVASGYASQSIALNPGNNSITLVVTAQSGVTKTYTINVVRALTDDANLSHLQVRIYGNYVIPLDTVISDFDLSFANTVTSVEVVATAVESLATIKLNGADAKSGNWSNPINLTVGTNTFTVLVTAPDGTTVKTYTIRIVRRAATEARLDSLVTSSGSLNPAFNADVTSYALNVANDVDQITFTPTGNGTSSGITVDGIAVNSGENSQPINLVEGVSKDVAIVVTAQDQTTTETYTIKVTRAFSDNADLSNLVINNGVLVPDFDKDITDYTVSVGNNVTSMTVTPTSAEAKLIQVNGEAVDDGLTSNPISLSVGNNSILVVVQAQNGDTKTYTLVVTRALSSNANLTSLMTSEGNLTPEFNALTTVYEVTVDTETSLFAVTPTAEDSTAVVRVQNMVVTSGQMSGNYAIGYGDTLMTILVTAQDGTVKNYLVTVHRPLSTDATLSSLNTNHGLLTPVFNNATTDYTLELDRSVSEVVIWGVKHDDEAIVTYELDDVQVDDINLSLQVGVTYKVEVIVTAQDLTTIKTYTIMVTRLASDDATLSSLTASSGSWDVEFDSETNQYQIDVANATSSITLTPTKSDDNAELVCKVDGNIQSLTGGALEILLDAGVSKSVTFTLTAEDTTTIKSYTVVVTRAAGSLSNNAYLSGLSVSADGWLNLETFNPNTLDYTLTVSNAKDSIVMTPVLDDSSATMSYKLDGSDMGVVGGDISVTGLDIGVAKEVEIIVTAEDGTTIRTYSINVVRSRLLSDFELTYNEVSYPLDLNSTDHELTVTITEGSGLVQIVPVFEDGHINPGFELSADTMTATIDEQIVTYTVSSVSNQPGSNPAMLRDVDGSIVYFVNVGEVVTISIKVTEQGEEMTYLIHLIQP